MTAAAVAGSGTAITAGTPVYGDWGAMFPRWYGEVVQVTPKGYYVQWEDQEDAPGPQFYDNIAMERPATGSPIGIYVDKRAIQRRSEA